MNQVQTTIIDLIDHALHQKVDSVKITTDWDEIYTELNNQSVVGIPLEYMIKHVDASEETKKHWTVMVYSQVAQWTKLMEEQDKLINLLSQNDIPMAIIKGSAAAMNYPKPDYRSMGDVDFFVKAEDFDRTYQLLLDNGYTYVVDEYLTEIHANNEKYHHVELSKNDILFELHRRMSDTMQGKEIDERIEELIQDGMDHIETKKVCSYEFPMFEKKLNGLIILRHIVQHLSGFKGVGLRHVIDWMEFVEKNLDDEFWNSEMAEYLQQVKLKEVAIVFARMGQLYLGLDQSITWCKGEKTDSLCDTVGQMSGYDADRNVDHLDTLCRRWMEEILASGDFGAKQTAVDEGADVLYKNKNIFSMLKSLQGLGLSHWESARKHKILRPFAWAYQAGRYAKKGLGRKAPIKSLKEDMNKSKYKKEMLERLNIK